MKRKKTLHDLIRSGSFEEIEKALQTASSDEVNEYGQTALIVAIHTSYRNDSEAVFDLVLNWDTNLNKKDIDGYTAFSHAVSLRRGSFMEKLLQKDIDVNVPCVVTVAPHPRAYEAFEHSVSSRKRRQYPVCTQQIMSPLCAVIYKSYDYLIPDIVEKGADLDTIGGLDITALSIAIRTGKLDVVKYLLDKGANPNVLPANWREYAQMEEDVCPVALKKALKYGNASSLAMLIDANVRVPEIFPRKDNIYSTPLTYLFSQPYGQIEDAFLSLKLLKNKVSVAILDSFNKPALSYAIENGFQSYIFSDLMDERINNQLDNFFKTPMIYAYEKHDYDAMKMLFEGGIEIAGYVNPLTGKSLLMEAICSFDTPMVSFMLQHKPNLLHKDKDGKTVLDYLAFCGEGMALKINALYNEQIQNIQIRKAQNER